MMSMESAHPLFCLVFYAITDFPVVLLPHRYEGGYGLSENIIARIPDDTDLIITVDCGISDMDAVSVLMKKWMSLSLTITSQRKPFPLHRPSSIRGWILRIFRFSAVRALSIICSFQPGSRCLRNGFPLHARHHCRSYASYRRE